MKFSIIIPVYNVEKYIEKCLNSILNQSYKNYEVIIVNDGTKDNSVSIIEMFLSDDRFKLYNKENGGLSDARNYGLNYVTGEYILFIDSDDYIEKDLLENLNEVLTKTKYDLVRYNINVVTEDGKLLSTIKGPEGSKEMTVEELINVKQTEIAWSYAYNKDFFIKNNFKYQKGYIHEDYGLTPLVILKANSIYYLDKCEYNYVQRENSIIHGSEKNLKRCNDVLFHFDNLYSIITKDESINKKDKEIMLSFLANGLILKCNLLEGKDLKNYIKTLKEKRIFKYLLSDTLGRKLKKLIVRISPSLYIKITNK